MCISSSLEVGNMSFQGKVVLVTGASSGIGAAIALKFTEEGAKLSLVGRNKKKLNHVANLCGNPLVLIADVTNDEDVKKIVDETVQHFGQLDVLINNAGVIDKTIMHDHAIEAFDKVIAINLRAPVLITNMAVPHLVKTKGNIVNISSAVSVRGVLSFTYCTSKAALDHFSRSIALDLATKGIRVNTVNPGPVKTEIFENAGATDAQATSTFDIFKKMTALNRVSEPEEVADLVVFLASEKAKAVTGSSYFTDNGVTLKI